MQSRPALKPALDYLLDLNRDYIRAVETSDVSRFAEILADDFLCSRTARSGPLHGRVGTEERPMAGRLSPRHPLLRCANPLEPSFRVTPFFHPVYRGLSTTNFVIV